MPELWGTDAPISLPSTPPKERPILVDLGGSGFAFTAGGICHNLNAADLEELQVPDYTPPGIV